MAKYMPGGDLTNLSYVLAYGVSLTMPQVVKRCGDDLSRENIMKQTANLKDFGDPVLLPGIKVNTRAQGTALGGATNFHPIKAMRLMKWYGKTWVPFGGIIEGV
jgi:hypothetical protein